MAEFLRRFFPNRKVGCHSVKRGVGNILIEAAAAGLIPTELVAQLLKHLGAATLLPDTTVRYLQNRVALALANRSGEATRLIPTNGVKPQWPAASTNN